MIFETISKKEKTIVQEMFEAGYNVIAVLNSLDKSIFIIGKNLITDAGDQYYAEGAVGNPSWTVNGMRLGTGTTTPSKTDTDVSIFLSGSGKAIDSGYPKTNDNDTDNTGAGIKVVSWRVSYGTNEANGNNISEGAIVDNILLPTKALCHFLFSQPFNKTSSDTLKIFVNHTFNGV